jgi:hypothetical protein
MGKANPIYTNFSAGEWSARMEGRIGVEKYYSSCRTLENMLVVSQGGADFRPGTKYIVKGKTAGLKIRLIPFSIRGVGEYILELGNLYMRFIKCSTHAQLGAPAEIVTPWPTAALFELKYAQTKDAMYFVHPTYPPQKLVRTNDTTWVLSVPVFDGWLKSTEVDIEGITQAGPPVITSTGHGFINGDVVYITDIVGMTYLNDEVYTVTRINADTFSLNDIDTTTYNPWVSGGKVIKAGNLFGTADNYPAVIGFYMQRMMLGGTNNYPDTVWCSKVGDFLDYKLPDGMEFTIAHEKGLVLRWIAGKSELAFGADSCEGVIGSTEIFYDWNYMIRVESGYGSKNIQGRLLNENILYVQDGGKRIREFAYSREAGGWLSPDLTLYADHITGDGITEMAVQRNPDTMLWCVRSDGVLAVLTYEYRYSIFGWCRVILGATVAGASEVESIAIARGDTEDEIYVSVKRTVNDVTSRFIEYFSARDFGSNQADAYFVDAGITWDGGDDETITNITQADPAVVTCAGHPFVDGDFVKVMEVVGDDAGLIDFQDFAQIDEGAAITVDSAIQITVDELYRDEEGLLYRFLGHDFLNNAFEYTLKLTLDAFPTDSWSVCGVWGVADDAKHINDLITDDNNGLVFIASRSAASDYKLQIWEVHDGEEQITVLDTNFALATPYYVKINRTITGGISGAGELTISVYSDIAMLTLIETRSISLHTVVNYEYLYAVWNDIDLAHHNYASYTLENLSGPANRGSYNHKVFKVDNAGANTFELDDEDDVDINGYHYKQYVSGGTLQKVIQTVTGLDHLEGEEIAVLVDGSTHSKETVESGAITLDRYGNKIHAGLGYTPKLKPARPEAGGSYGSAQGKKKRINRLILRVYKSLNCLIGPDEDNLKPIIFREGDDVMGSPPELFSGDKEVTFLGPWQREGDILISQETPTPLNILAIMPEIVTND